MKGKISAVTAALVLTVASVSSALALSDSARTAIYRFNDVETTGSIGPNTAPAEAACPAGEGRGDRQDGRTADGTRC